MHWVQVYVPIHNRQPGGHEAQSPVVRITYPGMHWEQAGGLALLLQIRQIDEHAVVFY